MRKTKIPTLIAAAALAFPMLAHAQYQEQQQRPFQAGPGTLNYVEGQVAIDGQPVTPRAVGSADIAPGQTIETAQGRAEVLLTPGVFLRLGHDSAVTMVSPSLTNTELKVDKGEADVEVDNIYSQNHIAIDADGDQGVLLKNGLYEFNAKGDDLAVFSGKAAVFSNSDDVEGQKPVIVKGGHELALNGDPVKAVGFDKKEAENGLYQWSSLRSDYLGEANTQLANEYAYAGWGGFAPGWFWDSALLGYTWIPGGGAFFSPFGYGFYSPYYLRTGGAVYGRGFAGARFGGVAPRAGFSGVHMAGSGSFGGVGGFHGAVGGMGGGGLHGR